MFKIGDKVRCKYNDNGTRDYIGLEGEIMEVIDSSRHPYRTSFGGCASFSAEELELINNKSSMASLKEKFALVFKSEPEKSFIKAGIMDVSEEITTEGWEIFGTWLMKRNGADFKKEVVDPMLAADEENK